MNEKESPCRDCEQDEVCETVCERFAAWFRVRWAQIVELFRKEEK